MKDTLCKILHNKYQYYDAAALATAFLIHKGGDF